MVFFAAGFAAGFFAAGFAAGFLAAGFAAGFLAVALAVEAVLATFVAARSRSERASAATSFAASFASLATTAADVDAALPVREKSFLIESSRLIDISDLGIGWDSESLGAGT